MKSKLRIGLMALGSFLLTALFLAPGTKATNHVVLMRQVMAGLDGDPTIQFVEMRMSDSGQNQWANRTMLVFFNASGVETGRFLITSNPPGGTNFSVLFATQAFKDLPGAPVPNFIIPAGLLQPDSGKVCFKSPSPEGDSDPFPVNLCLSYGAFTADTEGGGSPAAALPITGAQSLKRLDSFANFFGAPNTNSHFALVDAAPQNTAGVSKGFSPDLSITKTHSGNFTPGVNGVYNIAVQNVGIGSTANSGTITVSDTLPTGLSFVSGTGTGWSCSAVAQAVTCTNPDPLAVGASSNITLTVGVSGAGGPNVINTATVSSAGEHNPSNNSSSNPTTITIPCSVTPITFGQTLTAALSNTDCDAPHRPGKSADLFTFSGTAGQQVAIRMRGTSVNTFLFLLNPNGTVAFSNDNCSGDDFNSCIPINAVSGGFFTLPTTGTYTIEATSFSSGAAFGYTLALSINGADLSIAKSHTGDFVVGTNGTYIINVQNNGTAATTGTTTVTDTLPAGMSFVSGTGTGWSCSAIGQTVTCTNTGSIAASFMTTIDLVVSVAAAAAPSGINTASVSTAGDPNAANNTSNDPTAVLGDNHLVQIRQVMTGANLNPAVQFVEMRMSDATQSLWANRVKLAFFDAVGNPTGEFTVLSNPPGGTNRSVLFATQAFANLPGAPVPDLIFPTGLLQPVSGKVCFKNTADPSAVAVSLCLSYGSFTGDTEGAGSPAPPLPVNGARSLMRLVINAGDFGGPPIVNPGSNQNSHFEIADAVPENSGGPSLPMSFFSDVASNHFARRHIQAMANVGITSGCGVSIYCPDSNVTRAQMSVFIIRAMGQTAIDPPTGVFADVPPNAFAAGFIERMAQLGITNGCGSGNYCPDSPVKREQMAVFIIRALSETPVSQPSPPIFLDVPDGAFAKGFIERLAQINVTNGCGGGNYCPGSSVPRWQMAVFLTRAFSLTMPP